MKKNDVKIGLCYMAKVTGNEVPVRIDAENRHGGWDAKNVATERKVRIKSAQRLRRQCTEADLAGLRRPAPRRRKKTATKATTSPTLATAAKSAEQATKEAKIKKAATRAKQGDKKVKRPSGLDAAARVLAESMEPMNCRQIVETAFEKGYWHSDGATPWATIYSAMIREIATKGGESRFKKVDRGRFAANK